MERPARAFIFDLDGTLADTMPSHYVAWTKVAARHGLTFPEARFYSLGGVPTAKIAGMLITEAGLTLDPKTDRPREGADLLRRPGPGGIVAIEPVLALARSHRELKEGPLAVASGSVRRLVTRTLAALGITDWFAAVVAAEDTARHKPEPDVFLEAARRMDAAPAACTVYEDTDIGLEAARRAGMHPVDVRLLIAAAAAAPRLRRLLFDPEERGDLRHQLVLLHGGRDHALRGRLAERDLPPRQDVADDAGQLRLLLQDLLEGFLVDDVALDVGLGDDRRRAHGAGHQRHLAEELTVAQRGDLLERAQHADLHRHRPVRTT